MDLVSLAKDLLAQNIGKDVDGDTVTQALSALTGSQEGGFDLGSLVSKIKSSGGIGDIVESWLGDGDNLPIDADTVKNLFDTDQLEAFASKIGLDGESATSVLANVLPDMVDKSSSGGSLLDSIGGFDGAIDMMKKFF